jgi:hypothetical protein
MATIKLQDGKVITKNGKVSCSCCVLEIPIDYKYSTAYAENNCGAVLDCVVYQTQKFPFFTNKWTSTETGNVDPETAINEILCNFEVISEVNSEDPNYVEYLDPIEIQTLYYTEYADYITEDFVSVEFYRSRSNNIKVGDKITYRIPPERIPEGYTVKIQKSYQTYGISEGSCFLDIFLIDTIIAPEEEYAGGEVEFITEDFYNTLYEDSDSVFRIIVNINAVLEPSA